MGTDRHRGHTFTGTDTHKVTTIAATDTHTHTLTLRVSEEDDTPDAGNVGEEEADGQDHPLLHLPADPADEDEASNHLHSTHTVHHTVLQFPKIKVLLCQWSHHCLLPRQPQHGTHT